MHTSVMISKKASGISRCPKSLLMLPLRLSRSRKTRMGKRLKTMLSQMMRKTKLHKIQKLKLRKNRKKKYQRQTLAR